MTGTVPCLEGAQVGCNNDEDEDEDEAVAPGAAKTPSSTSKAAKSGKGLVTGEGKGVKIVATIGNYLNIIIHIYK